MPTASARCCPAISAAAPATSRSSRRCSMPAPPTGKRRRGRRMKNTFIGSAVERREDLRFVRGRGQYVDDLQPDGLLHAVILRSSVAHGRIRVDRRRGGAADRRRARRHHGEGHAGRRRRRSPMRLQPLPEFKPFEQPVIADGQGPLCRRAGRGGAGGKRRRSARTRWSRSQSTSSRCRR